MKLTRSFDPLKILQAFGLKVQYWAQMIFLWGELAVFVG